MLFRLFKVKVHSPLKKKAWAKEEKVSYLQLFLLPPPNHSGTMDQLLEPLGFIFLLLKMERTCVVRLGNVYKAQRTLPKCQ